MGDRKLLTKQQVLNWRREKWSYTDLKFIEHALDQLPNEGLEVFEYSGTIYCEVKGEQAFRVCPGYVYWPKGTWAKSVDPTLIPGGLEKGQEKDGTLWSTLSTFRETSREHRQEREYGVCPNCYMQLPATGVCGAC